MNDIWQSVSSASGMHLLPALHPLVAETATGTSLPPLPGLDPNTTNLILRLGGAILTLLIGFIAAVIVSRIVRGVLKQTKLDDRIGNLVGRGRPGRSAFQVEKLAGTIAFWLIMILTLVAFFNTLQLNTVSQPLNNFLTQIFAFLPRLGSAAVLGVVAWILAALAKAVTVSAAQSFGLDEKLADPDADPMATNSFSISETLGNALYWFVFLFFLPIILGVLDLQGPLQPVQNLLNQILSALPNIIMAVAIGAVGWFLARVVRGVVTNLLAATGTDRLGSQFGIGSATGGRSLSWLAGTIVYALILIPTAIAALDALKIPAISGPATAMLSQVLNAFPLVFTAGAILVVSYFVGKFIADLASSILSSVGFDNIFYWLGLQSAPATPKVAPEQYDTQFQTGETLLQDDHKTKTPSEIVGIVVLVGVMLFATVAATNVLNIPALTAIVSGLLLIFGQILVGLVVFAVGLYLANLAFSIINSSGTRQSNILAQTARIAIIALVSAMALQQMGIATNIVNLAFGLLLGAIAVAIAIAFGLGGRDVAAEQLRDWLKEFKR